MKTAVHLADRVERARQIIDNVQHFKICEGCDSIVTQRVIFCPNCHSYRFNEDPVEVITRALLLSSRPQTSVIAADFE